MPPPSISSHLQDQIVSLYQSGKLVTEVEALLGLSYKTVVKYLRKAGITIRRANLHNKRYDLNQTFFDTIDTEEKAYWLGFLYADGNVSISQSNHTHVLNLNLQERDRHMVDAFRAALSYSGPVFTKRYANPRCQTAYGVNICCKPLCLALIRLGCTPRKSLTLQFPTSDQVPDHLLRHFVRGYFDGDGTVGAYPLNPKPNRLPRYVAGIMSSSAFINKLREHLATRGIHTALDSSHRAHVARIHRIESLRGIAHLMYDNATIWLDRKRDKFIALESRYAT